MTKKEAITQLGHILLAMKWNDEWTEERDEAIQMAMDALASDSETTNQEL